jgi:hypothetical protein
MDLKWQEPAISSTSDERPTMRTWLARGSWTRAAFVLLFAAGLTVYAFWARDNQDQFLQALATEGRPTAGRVIEITERRHKRKLSYFVHYQYSVGGSRYRSSYQIKPSERSRVQLGDAVTVTYLPSDPQRSIGQSLAEARLAAARSATTFKIASIVVWAAAIWTTFTALRNRV